MPTKLSSPDHRPNLPKASRAPHRKTNQAQERQDAAASRPGARECDPAGPEAWPQPALTGGWPGVPAGCPISPDILLVVDLSEDLNRAMRQLRRKLVACKKCPLDAGCGFRREFEERVKVAIREVNAEWARRP
jgi:hypothetical protein